jgi:hypothetical protein
MNGVNLQFNAATVAPQQAFDPIPNGWQRAKMIESEMQPTKEGTGNMLVLTFEVLDGPYKGRKLFDRLNLQNPNQTTVQIAYGTLSSICHATGVIQCQNSQQLHNIPLLVKVKLRNARTTDDGKTYDANNEIRGYDNINSAHEVNHTAPNHGSTGLPGNGAPAWAGGQPAAAAPPAFAPPPAQYAPPPPMQAPPPAFAPPPAAAGGQPWEQPSQPAQTWQPPVAPPGQPAAAAPPAFNPPPPPPGANTAGPVMLPKAGNTPYEAFRAGGWTDQQLIEQGMMAAPAAPQPPQGVLPPPATPGAPGGAPWAT